MEMGRKSMENYDYTNSEYTNIGANNQRVNYQQKYGEENRKLRETLSALNQKMDTSQLESERRYEELLEAVSELSKRVHSVTDGQTRPSQSAHSSNQNNEDVKGKTTENKMDALRGTINTLTEDLTDLDLKFQLHENSTNDGHLIWKINDFNNRSNDAVIGKVRALHSAPCYTEKYGYKFCLRLYLHGDGMGRGTHLSLFLVIMQSEYDDILQWPFQKKIEFKLINQKDRSKDHVEQIFPNKDSSSFQQPKKEMNIASGCPLFISLDQLEPEGFLKNGNLFFEVKIN